MKELFVCIVIVLLILVVSKMLPPDFFSCGALWLSNKENWGKATMLTIGFIFVIVTFLASLITEKK